MKLLLILVSLCLVGLVYVKSESAAPSACKTGEAQGFAALRWDPIGLVGELDGESQRQRWFWRRYNCTGRGVSIRRVDRGVYDIEFPGLGYRMAVVSAINQEGTSASVQPFGTGLFRVVLRGPVSEDRLLQRVDVPFAIAVF